MTLLYSVTYSVDCATSFGGPFKTLMLVAFLVLAIQESSKMLGCPWIFIKYMGIQYFSDKVKQAMLPRAYLHANTATCLLT